MENVRIDGQYGKRNPLFMYQRTAGYSFRTVISTTVRKEQDAQVFKAAPAHSGDARCGLLQN